MIELFTSNHCQNCRMVKQILSRKGYEYLELDINFSHATKQDLFNRCSKQFNWQSIDDVIVPILFVNKHYIGTIDEIYQLIEFSQLSQVIDDKIAQKSP